jgi:tetratricopeptide (TPR) repeat protein
MKLPIGVSSLAFFAILASISRAGSERAHFEDGTDQNFSFSIFSSLPLKVETRAAVERAVRSHEYTQAEEVLFKEIQQQPNSYALLAFLGRVFFLHGEYFKCAVAMKKADAVSSLKDPERFTLALSYIVLSHEDWARSELEKLSAADSSNPLYHYWLGRIDYDKMNFTAASASFQRTLQLNPNFVKAHDNLALTYEALGQFDDAIESYNQALSLNRRQAVPSPWPPLNLGALLVKLGKFEAAENCLRESLRFDPRFPKAHYQFGLLLEKENKDLDAIEQLRQAAQYDPPYPEPHYILGRIFRRMGKEREADVEFATFRELKQEHPRK